MHSTIMQNYQRSCIYTVISLLFIQFNAIKAQSSATNSSYLTPDNVYTECGPSSMMLSMGLMLFAFSALHMVVFLLIFKKILKEQPQK